jgi:hypothetical protein
MKRQRTLLLVAATLFCHIASAADLYDQIYSAIRTDNLARLRELVAMLAPPGAGLQSGKA